VDASEEIRRSREEFIPWFAKFPESSVSKKKTSRDALVLTPGENKGNHRSRTPKEHTVRTQIRAKEDG
jgi:hypothetical protein